MATGREFLYINMSLTL